MRILTVGCSLAGLAQEPNPTAGKTARYLKLKYDKQKKPDNRRSQANVTQ